MRLYPKGSQSVEKLKKVKGAWRNPILPRLDLIVEREFSTEMLQLGRSWILDCSMYRENEMRRHHSWSCITLAKGSIHLLSR